MTVFIFRKKFEEDNQDRIETLVIPWKNVIHIQGSHILGTKEQYLSIHTEKRDFEIGEISDHAFRVILNAFMENKKFTCSVSCPLDKNWDGEDSPKTT